MLSPHERAHILDDRFVRIMTVEQLPESVRTTLAEAFRRQKLEIADPGKPYRVGDIGGNGPVRRLVFAGMTKNGSFVYYEKGSRGHGYYLIVFRIDAQGRAQFRWGGAAISAVPADSLQYVRSELSAGLFDDKVPYSW